MKAEENEKKKINRKHIAYTGSCPKRSFATRLVDVHVVMLNQKLDQIQLIILHKIKLNQK